MVDDTEIEKEKKRVERYYEKTRLESKEYAEKISLNLDKVIFGLSSGALILSINFIDKISTIHNIDSVIYLKFSWWFFVVSMLANVISHILVFESEKLSKKSLDSWRCDKLETFKHMKSCKNELEYNELINELDVKPNLENKFGSVNKIFHVLSFSTLIFGIISLAIFASFNINQISYVEEEHQETISVTTN